MGRRRQLLVALRSPDWPMGLVLGQARLYNFGELGLGRCNYVLLVGERNCYDELHSGRD